jgi:hypothetical protein
MSEVSFSNIFNPGQRFLEGAYQSSYDNNAFILSSGVVLDVAREVNFDKESSKTIPQYSIRAKIIGEGVLVESNNNFTAEVDEWYIPLLSTHTISLPEIGEEVLIVRETTSPDSKGYWIGRVNNSPWVSTHLVGDSNTDGAFGETGFNLNPSIMNERFNDIQPSSTTRNTGVPAKLGDVIQQGRTRTYIRHSFSPARSKRAILEMGIMNKRFYPLKDNIATIGRTATKTVHIERGKLSDIGSRTKLSPIPKIVMTPGGPRKVVDKNAVRNYIANMADEIYNISLEPDAEEHLHRHVLGEKLVDYQEELGDAFSQTLDKLSEVVSTMQDFLSKFLDHTHGIPEINIQIPDKEVSFVDFRRDPPKVQYRAPVTRIIPSIKTRTVIPGPVVEKQTWDPYTETVVTKKVRTSATIVPIGIPSRKITVPQSPIVTPGRLRASVRKKKIKFDAITVGGTGNKRETTSVETDITTRYLDENLNTHKKEFAEQINGLTTLISNARDILSKRHYLN